MIDNIPRPSGRPGEVIVHPIILALLVLWIINDHVLKAWLANAWTGKLSDVASLAVFPLLPFGLYEVACARLKRPPRHADAVLLASLAATGFVMASINTWAPAAEAYRWGLAAAQQPFRCLLGGFTCPPFRPVFLTVDPTDLITLPALVIPWFLARGRGAV